MSAAAGSGGVAAAGMGIGAKVLTAPVAIDQEVTHCSSICLPYMSALYVCLVCAPVAIDQEVTQCVCLCVCDGCVCLRVCVNRCTRARVHRSSPLRAKIPAPDCLHMAMARTARE